jgi:hypothetical protein
MLALIEKIASQGGATRAEVRKDLAKPNHRPSPKRSFCVQGPPLRAFALKLKFKKGHVAKQEVISALEEISRPAPQRVVSTSGSRLRTQDSGFKAQNLKGPGFRRVSRLSRRRKLWGAAVPMRAAPTRQARAEGRA